MYSILWSRWSPPYKGTARPFNVAKHDNSAHVRLPWLLCFHTCSGIILLLLHTGSRASPISSTTPWTPTNTDTHAHTHTHTHRHTNTWQGKIIVKWDNVKMIQIRHSDLPPPMQLDIEIGVLYSFQLCTVFPSYEFPMAHNSFQGSFE